ncbi:hypothetical protein B0J11DRAFT_437402 [Dendryphion nanum]|uniref:Uncharacterized protein n=1 Tax=Dendryphion nanum TaxID=256645 RepID=A0A9P9DKK6_9PLEO|nr:hypothetical protein B0J11DRAFT_437402 [Dendryphion nanum]
MLQVCEQLGCVRLLYPYFNTVIVEQRQKVYIAIRLDAARWMRLAISLESTSIYTECLIHLAGAWPHWPWKTDRNTLPNELLKLVATKSKQIDDQCLEINQDLLLSTICVGRKGEPVTCAPEQMETWLLVQTFRDILASGIRNMNASNRRSLIQGKFYRRIHKGGEHYMSFEEVRCTCLDILPKGSWKELGSDLSDIKKYASVLVAPLAKNNLMIDPDAYNVGYLTCTEVYPSDVPWEQDVMEVA